MTEDNKNHPRLLDKEASKRRAQGFFFNAEKYSFNPDSNMWESKIQPNHLNDPYFMKDLFRLINNFKGNIENQQQDYTKSTFTSNPNDRREVIVEHTTGLVSLDQKAYDRIIEMNQRKSRRISESGLEGNSEGFVR